MIARFQLELQHNGISYRKSSNLQGVLLETAGPAFAGQAHEQGLHAYSQYLVRDEGRTIWVINAMNRDVAEKLKETLMDPAFQSFRMRFGNRGRQQVCISGKTVETIEDCELIDEFRELSSVDRFQLTFLTPVSFRQNGQYVIFPDLRLLFQSLITKCNLLSDQGSGREADPDLLDEIVRSVAITQYTLQSEAFPMERIMVPGFIGSMELRVRGEEMIRRYVRFLLHFGMYSGIGIKTGVGMGAINVSYEKKAGCEQGT